MRKPFGRHRNATAEARGHRQTMSSDQETLPSQVELIPGIEPVRGSIHDRNSARPRPAAGRTR
jgi:hypothetical protein